MSTCCKCKTELATVDIKFAFYCASCFLDSCFSKYRAGLSKCTTPGPCLIYARNDLASRLLIHFSQLPRILEPRRLNCTDFEVITDCPELAAEVKEIYHPLLTAVHICKGQLSLTELLNVAKDRNCLNLLLPETSTSTAASVLASVCKGRGQWIRWDGAIWRECDGIRVGTP